jgi:hypothetical protein
MSGQYTVNNFAIGTGGSVLWTPDDGDNNVLALQHQGAQFVIGDNPDFPALADAAMYPQNVTLGARVGNITQGGPVAVDRRIDTMLNTAFNIATYAQPWLATLKQSASADAVPMGKIWIGRMNLMGQYAVSGQATAVGYSLSAMVLDPDNRKTLSALAAPEGQGTTGLGFSSNTQTTLTDGQESPTDYTLGLRSWAVMLNNNLILQPTPDDTYGQYRMPAGCTPGPRTGLAFQVVELAGAPNPVPMTAGFYTFNVIIPSPDGTHSITIKINCYHEANTQTVTPDNLLAYAVSYRIVGSGNNGTGTDAIVAVYA